MNRFVKILGTCMVAVLLVLFHAVPGKAVPAGQTLRFLATATETGSCCFSWGETVSVAFGTSAVPVVVTWDADLANSGRFLASIMLNGGSCGTFGGQQIPAGPVTVTSTGGAQYGPGYQHVTFQWIVYPSDGLVAGTTNSFTLCGGAHPTFNPGGSLSLGFNTLAVRKGA